MVDQNELKERQKQYAQILTTLCTEKGWHVTEETFYSEIVLTISANGEAAVIRIKQWGKSAWTYSEGKAVYLTVEPFGYSRPKNYREKKEVLDTARVVEFLQQSVVNYSRYREREIKIAQLQGQARNAIVAANIENYLDYVSPTVVNGKEVGFTAKVILPIEALNDLVVLLQKWENK